MSRKRTGDCPKTEDFVGALMGETGDWTEGEFRDHVRSCPLCRPRTQILANVRAELEARADSIPETRLTGKEERALRRVAVEQLRSIQPPRRRLSFSPLPVAATVMLAVIALALGYVNLKSTLHSRFAVRGTIHQELRLLEPGPRLGGAPADFSWTDVPGRDEFRFVLIDGNLNTVFEIDTHATGLKLPEGIRRKLLKGNNYLWTVLALDDNDRELASASREFEIE